MAENQAFRQAQGKANAPDLILEQFPKGLYQLKLHPLRKAAHVMVRLNDMGLAELGGRGLDHIGVDGALSKVGHALKLGSFPLEHLDEGLPNNLPLTLRIAFPSQLAEELSLRIHANDVQGEAVIGGLAEGLHNLIPFLQAKQAVVDEHANKLIADRAVQQGCHHGGIHAPGETQQHLARSHLPTDRFDGVVHDIGRSPEGLAAAHFPKEAAKHGLPLLRMGNLGMELHAVEMASRVGHGCNGRVGRLAAVLKARRQSGHPIPVAHPHVVVRSSMVYGVAEEGIGRQPSHSRVAKFTLVRGLHRAPQLKRHGLHAIANA